MAALVLCGILNQEQARPWNTVRNLPVHFWAGANIMAKSNLRLGLRITDSHPAPTQQPGHGPRPRAPDRARGRAPDQGSQGQPPRPARCDLIGFRHGLRVSELCDLQWSSIAFETGMMHVRRAKGGQEATHPLLGNELRALRVAEAPGCLALRLCLGAWWSVHPVGLCQAARPRRRRSQDRLQGSPAHAPACLRLRAGQ